MVPKLVRTRPAALLGIGDPSFHQHIALQKMVFDGPTRARRYASPQYMEAISIDDVCEACDQILRRKGRDAA